MTENTIVTEINGEVTELTEEEIIFLLELRMLSEEEQKILLEQIKNLKSE